MSEKHTVLSRPTQCKVSTAQRGAYLLMAVSLNTATACSLMSVACTSKIILS